MTEAEGQSIIDKFFAALQLMQLETCQTQLAALTTLAQENAIYQPWCQYLTGIMAEQFDHNWAEAERLFKALLEVDLPISLYGRVLNSLGITYRRQGLWQEALNAYEQSLAIFDQPNQLFARAKVWKNMATVLEVGFSQGDFEPEALNQAIGYCQQTLTALKTLTESNLTDDLKVEELRWLEAVTWNTLGIIYRDLGQWSQAIDSYQRRIELGYRLNDRYGIGLATSNLAEILQRQGPAKWAEAEQAYHQALAIYREFGHIYDQIDVLANLGTLHREMETLDTALTYYHEALDLAESIRAQLTAPTSQIDYRTTIEALYTAPLSIHLERGSASLAFTAAERARSRVLADLLAGQKARPQVDLPAHLLTLRADLRHLLDQAYAAEDPPNNLPYLEKALVNLDRQIELLDPSYAGLATVDPLTAETVCAQLSANAALLTYVADDQDHLWILVATSAGIETKRVENLSISWLRDYLASCLDGPRRSGLLPKRPGGHLTPPRLFPLLYQTLIAPVWSTLQAVRTVYIIPFGPLHYLPLGALTPALPQPPPLLATGRRVVYAPSATILFTYCHARSASPHKQVLTVAPHDTNLQFTVGAAQAIARQANGSALSGAAATRAAFLTAAGQQRLICFLGHALFDQQHPMTSRLKLADSTLQAREMLHDLRLHADLVMLSACETGRSQVLRGDEILGLSRAMLYAGTPALLVTLWSVHEVPTRLLVEKLMADLPLSAESDASFDPALALAACQNWLRQLTVAETEILMHRWDSPSATEIKAQLTGLWQMTHPGTIPSSDDRLFAHPFFWSPYVLIGEPRQSDT